MGEMKFEMPNDFGIYLHDTPHKELFAQEERHLSNGCVRLEDYRRFATWVFGRVPQASTSREERFTLPRPVPIYMTYLTVAPAPNGVVFRPDPYGFDALAMPQMFGSGHPDRFRPLGETFARLSTDRLPSHVPAAWVPPKEFGRV
jgi:murein L,D-transpeptidase YcbB/YkuD